MFSLVSSKFLAMRNITLYSVSVEVLDLYHDIEYVLIRNSHTLNHSRFFLGNILCFRIILNFVTLVNQKNVASYIFVFYIPHMCGGRVKAFKISFPAFLLRCCLIPRVPEQGSPASPQACHNLTANYVTLLFYQIEP